MFEDEDLDHPDFGRPHRKPPVEWGSWLSLWRAPQTIERTARRLAFFERSCVRFMDAVGPDLWIAELYNGARYQLHVADLMLGSLDGSTQERAGEVRIEPAGVSEEVLPAFQHRRLQDIDALIVHGLRQGLLPAEVDRVAAFPRSLAEAEALLIAQYERRLETCVYWCFTELDLCLELWVAEPLEDRTGPRDGEGSPGF